MCLIHFAQSKCLIISNPENLHVTYIVLRKGGKCVYLLAILLSGVLNVQGDISLTLVANKLEFLLSAVLILQPTISNVVTRLAGLEIRIRNSEVTTPARFVHAHIHYTHDISMYIRSFSRRLPVRVALEDLVVGS